MVRTGAFLAKAAKAATAMVVLCAVTAARAEDKTADLPVSRVVLFSGGVAYFEHAGKVTGDATVRLIFNADQINDVLKSMSVSAQAGTVGAVSYPSNDPLLRSLKSFAVDVSGEPKLADLLKQLRGATVTVTPSGGGLVTGRILGVETRQKELTTAGTTKVLPDTELSLLTAEGIKTVSMSGVANLALADPRLAEELGRALSVLIGAHDTLRKPVDVRFQGDGERAARIGYLVEAPVWKTAYRLDLTGKQPALQGWAIIENTSDADWSNVELTLVSGKPVSFIHDLYTPLFVKRPIVEPKTDIADSSRTVYEATRPGDEEGDKNTKAKEGYHATEDGRAASTLVGRLYAMRNKGGGGGMGGGGTSGIFEEDSSRGGGVEAVARGEKVGELFHFVVKGPVSLARRRSAMLPIVSGPIQGEKVSLYNPNVLRQHPLNAVYLTNDTGLKLLEGPVTVFDGTGGTSFAGEAMMDTLIPKGRAILCYAADLYVTVDEKTEFSEKTLGTAIGSGRVTVKMTNTETWTYQIASKADQPRTVVVCVPRRNNWTVVEPAAVEERTDDEVRAKVAVPANSERNFIVRTQGPGWGSVELLGDRADPGLERYAKDPAIPQDVRTALEKVRQMHAEIAKLEADRTATANSREAILAEQGRLRENIKAVGADNRLAQRYIEKLNKQEDQIESLAKAIEQFNEQVKGKEEALTKHVNSLQVGDQGIVKEFEKTMVPQ